MKTLGNGMRKRTCYRNSLTTLEPCTMWLAVVVICLALVAVLVKYVLGTGPNPFDIDTREPPKPIEFDRKLKNKVLKQGESEIQYVDQSARLHFIQVDI